MILEKEFKEIIKFNYLDTLDNDVIIPYIMNCFKSLKDFIEEETHTSVRFTYNNTDRIIQEFYRIGIENCKKEYEHYNLILKFKAQYQLDYQLMRQIRQKWFNNNFIDRVEFKDKCYENIISLDIYKFKDRDLISKNDMEFYINKYKFYNSFKITLS